MNETIEILTGQTESHLNPWTEKILVHAEVVSPLKQLGQALEKAGIELKVISGFRSLKRQIEIWNEKCEGKRPVFDDRGTLLDVKKMVPEKVVHAILRFSALPGASRHHWGTDLDVIDRKATPPNYHVQLTPQEAEKSGPFHRIHEWFSANLSKTDFFRPYEKDLGGVSPEWWHISFRPLAEKFMRSFAKEDLHATLSKIDFQLKDIVLKELDAIWRRYVTRISG